MALPTLRTFATDICETTSTLGSGTYSLNGARTGYRSFATGYDTNDTPYYVVRSADDTKYEHNRGGVFTDGSPDTLTRNVLYSSNGNAPVVWVSDDLPLNVYVPNAAEVFELLVRGWVANSRDAWLKFGHWFDSAVSNVVTWKIFDGSADITMGNIDLLTSTLDFKYVPAGAVIAFAGSTVPTYFLACQGQSLLRASYPELFIAIGTTYGAVDGTHFTLPNIGGRVIAGKETSATLITGGGAGFSGSTLGASGGQQTEAASVSVSVGVSGSIAGATYGSTSVSAPAATGGTAVFASGGGGVATGYDHNHDGAITTGVLGVTGSGSMFGSGSGATSTVTNVQPTIILNYMISTGGR